MGATITKFDDYGFSPLYYADYYKYIDILNLLKINGAKKKIKKIKKDSFVDFIKNFDEPSEKDFFNDDIEQNKGYLKW